MHPPPSPPPQFGLGNLLDLKAEPQDVVTLDNYVQPVDRGPAMDARQVARSWQYQVTGKAAAAMVLAETKAEHVKSGEQRRAPP